jgi:hypothetical protein
MSALDPEPFDWWQPFTSGDMLKAPQQGQPSMQHLDAERPPLEQHAEQVARYAQDLVHRAPTPKETAAAIEQAQALRDWISEAWHDDLKGPGFFEQLEQRVYDAGLLSLWWGLSGNMPALIEFLGFMRDWQGNAGPDATAAITRADRREQGEWHVVAQAIGNMEYQATKQNSPRLRQAAKVMRAMLTADKLRPEAPAKEARRASASHASGAKHAPTRELKQKILAECMRLKQGENWKNQAARKIAPVAFRWNQEWNQEAGKPPFRWLDIPAAEKKIRRWLNNYPPRSARTA